MYFILGENVHNWNRDVHEAPWKPSMLIKETAQPEVLVVLIFSPLEDLYLQVYQEKGKYE